MFDLIANGSDEDLFCRLREISELPLRRKKALMGEKLDGKSLLHAAVVRGNVAFVQDLINFLNDLNIQIDQADNEGNTPLHVAVLGGSMQIIRELLANDFSLNSKNLAQKTAVDLAIEQAAAGHDTEKNLRVAALLLTRIAWQNPADVSIKFNRVVDLIEKCFPAINPAGGTDKLLCIGGTGAGKSTFLNSLNGTRYESGVSRGCKPFARAVGGTPELFKVGQGMISQTLYPQVNKIPGLNFSYCDLAGLGDSRGSAERICASSGVQMLSRLPGGIKGILLVLDIPGFNAEKGKSFKSTAVALATMVKNNPALMDHVVYVITKIPSECRDAYGKILTTAVDIIDSYVDPLLESLANDASSDDIALKFMLEQMKLHADNIIIPDVTDNGESKLFLENKISAFAAKQPGQYSFVSHDGSQKAFNDTLQAIAEAYVEKLAALKPAGLPRLIAEQVHRQRLLRIRIAEIEEEIRVRRNDNGAFDPAELDRLIAEKNAQLSANLQSINDKTLAISNRNTQLMALQGELGGLETDDMVYVDSLKYDIPGRPHQHNLRYQSCFPCYGPSSVGGFYWGYGKLWDNLLPECNAMSGLYSTMLNASDGLSRVDVTFHTQKRYIHAARIRDLHNQIADLQRLNRVDSRDIQSLNRENEQLRAEILACETEKIQGRANAELRAERLRAEIATREIWLAEAIRELNAAIAEQLRIEEKKLDVGREIDVNSDLFAIIYRVSHVLDLSNIPALVSFWNEYEAMNSDTRSGYDAWIAEMTQQQGGADSTLIGNVNRFESILRVGANNSTPVLRFQTEPGDVNRFESFQTVVPSHSISGLKYQPVPGDGHCLFTAVGLYLGQNQDFLRNIVAANIEHNMEQYRDIINAINPNKTPEEYLEDLRKGVEWADNLEISVLMKILDRPIVVVDLNGKIRNLSNIVGAGEPIFVQYNGHNHYDALILTGQKGAREIFGALTQLDKLSPKFGL